MTSLSLLVVLLLFSPKNLLKKEVRILQSLLKAKQLTLQEENQVMSYRIWVHEWLKYINESKTIIISTLIISDAQPKSPLEYIYFKAKEFQHFQYILNLTRECIHRLEKIRNNKDQIKLVLPQDVYIRIGIVGKYTEHNLSLLSKKKGNLAFRYVDIFLTKRTFKNKC